MESITIESKKIVLLRSDKGHYSDRFNRSVKLARNYYDLLDKFDRMIERGAKSNTEMFQCALACKLMLLTGIRVGNEKSANGYVSKRKDVGEISTYGLTTLQKKHIRIGKSVTFNFVGKRGIEQKIVVSDPLTVQQIKAAFIPANHTLLYISGYDLRKFVKKYIGNAFTPKDFRTLRANIEANYALLNISRRPKVGTKKSFKEECKEIAAYVASKLGNTPAMAKRAYIDPLLWEYASLKRAIV